MSSYNADVPFGGSYLPENARERLSAYVYRGTDKSLLYRYVFRPLCVRLVTYLPVWLSANVISVAALALVTCAHILIAVYMPDLTVKQTVSVTDSVSNGENMSTQVFTEEFQPPPMFVFMFAAFALFLYPILDNLDGHQARRTFTASPLGLIVDHGCDAFNCIIASLSIAATTMMGPTWKTFALLLSIVIPFFMNTWEEYYLGELVIPVINGANEGVMIGVGIYIVTVLMGGPQWWYINGVTLPQLWVPEVLKQSPPLAAVAIEKKVLHTVCPWISGTFFRTYSSFVSASVPSDTTTTTASTSTSTKSAFSALFGLTCDEAYISNIPTPYIAPDSLKGDDYVGHSILQNFVLSLYDKMDFHSIRLRYNTIGVFLFLSMSFITCVANFIRVYKAVHKPSAHGKIESGWMSRKMPFIHALTRLLPLITLTLFATLWFLSSPNNIFQKHPRMFSWTIGLLYTKSDIHLMIAHVCGIEFHPLRRTLWPFLFLGAHMTLTFYRNMVNWMRNYKLQSTSFWFLSANSVWDDLPNEEYVIWGLFLLSLVSFVHLVYGVVRETADALGVPVFKVPKLKQEMLLKQIAEERKKGKKE
ncbi:aminoalcohol phosphotransferase [Trypanosoma theileri]|uniref:Aminoalcohol phosphotransferase n=1 Tax=Trypanosoma theileri TaxID=67003 RepID=A0A1X0P8W0_9TRYP|nr:aminoalcohol phosphotransferase [Trypanosoma theileri]ORC93377.1 aminoalcohol phosphotransferase [Trypanosoma theileri]